MEPAHAGAEDRVPVEVARLQLRRRLVAAVVEDDGRAHAVAAIAVDRGHVRAPGAVVLEHLVERRHAHRPHPPGDQIADRVLDHRRRDAGAQAEAVGQVGGGVELAAADVDRAGRGLAKRDDARVEPVNERAEREEVESALVGNAQRSVHKRTLTLRVDSTACQEIIERCL